MKRILNVSTCCAIVLLSLTRISSDTGPPTNVVSDEGIGKLPPLLLRRYYLLKGYATQALTNRVLKTVARKRLINSPSNFLLCADCKHIHDLSQADEQLWSRGNWAPPPFFPVINEVSSYVTSPTPHVHSEVPSPYYRQLFIWGYGWLTFYSSIEKMLRTSSLTRLHDPLRSPWLTFVNNQDIE